MSDMMSPDMMNNKVKKPWIQRMIILMYTYSKTSLTHVLLCYQMSTKSMNQLESKKFNTNTTQH